MRKRTIGAAIVAAATAVLLLPSAAQAQDTVPVYVVHGINAAGETPVTVCVDGEPVLEDFAFTDFAGPLDLSVGAAVPITVSTEEVDACDDPAPIIDQEVIVPAGPVALVATSDGENGGYQLTPFELNLECAEAGQGRLSAFHASADTPAVTVQVGGDAVGELEFGSGLDAVVPAGDYPVTVLLGDTPVVGPDASVPVEDGVNTLVFVTGNMLVAESELLSAVVAIVEGVDVGTCDASTPPPTSIPVPETPVGPGAAPAAAVPTGGAPLSLTG